MPTWYHWVSVFIFNLIDLIKRNAQCRLTSLTTIDPIPDVLMYWYTAQYTTPPLMYWFTIQLTTPSLICTDVYWCTTQLTIPSLICTDVLHNSQQVIASGFLHLTSTTITSSRDTSMGIYFIHQICFQDFVIGKRYKTRKSLQ